MPPYLGSVFGRVRRWKPLAHDLVQTDQAEKAASLQSTGHVCALQVRASVWCAQALPPQMGWVSTRVRQLQVSTKTKTRDNVFVTIIVSTQYMVLRDPERMYDAFYKLTDSREQIRSYIFDVVGAGCVQLLNSVCQLPLAIETYASGLVRLVSRIASADCFSSHSLVTQPLNL